MFFNGIFASMFNTSVVVMAVFYRLASLGHLRDSDKPLFLWRSRFVSMITAVLFFWGTTSACLTLMRAVHDIYIYGGKYDTCPHGSFPDYPTMTWKLWWNQWKYMDREDAWIEYTGRDFGRSVPVSPTGWRIFEYMTGKGVVYPEGKEILNPWINRTKELNIVFDKTDTSGLQWQQDNEFMMDYWGFAQPCEDDFVPEWRLRRDWSIYISVLLDGYLSQIMYVYSTSHP